MKLKLLVIVSLLPLLWSATPAKAEGNPANLRRLLNTNQCIWCYLGQAKLSGAPLSGAVLAGTSLVYADLRNANLSNANLVGADLRSADLRGANLQGANLEGADMEGALTEGTIFTDARMPNGKLYEETVTE